MELTGPEPIMLWQNSTVAGPCSTSGGCRTRERNEREGGSRTCFVSDTGAVTGYDFLAAGQNGVAWR